MVLDRKETVVRKGTDAAGDCYASFCFSVRYLSLTGHSGMKQFAKYDSYMHCLSESMNLQLYNGLHAKEIVHST